MRIVKLAVVFPTNRSSLFREVDRGLSPDNGLYGYNYFRELGFTAEFADVSIRLERLLDRFFSPISWWWRKHTDITFQLGRALLSLYSMNRADVVLTNTDSIGMPVCLLKRLGLVRPPIVYAVGLFYIRGDLKEAIDHGRQSLFRRLYTWILSAADKIVYHSPIEKEKLVKLGLYSPATCTFVAMGSDANFFQKFANSELRTQSSKLILSVGRDHARDYETLFRAAEQLPEERFVVICSQRNINGLKVPANVQILRDLPYSDIREWYNKASLVVIPMQEMYRSSGQMTLTDSFQAEKPVIATDVVGIKHYELRNGRSALLVPPRDEKKLAEAIRLLAGNVRLRARLALESKKLAKHFTTGRYAGEIARAINETTESVRLRPFSPSDLPFLWRLRNRFRTYFFDSSYISFQNQKKWYESFRKKKDDFMFVLVKNAMRLGVGAIYGIDWEKKQAEAGRFMIDALSQGKGYGKALLQLVEEKARNELGLHTLILQSRADNKLAIKLYQSCGYRIRKKRNVGNTPVLVMGKRLRSIRRVQSPHATPE